MARIGFIGTGEIAKAMVLGLTGKGHSIVVSERNKGMAAQLGALTDVSVLPNQEVLDGTDYVVLCLMAEVAKDVLPTLRFRADQKIISVMVDMGHEALLALCAPATEVSITIPLPNIADGGCPLPCFPHAQTVSALFGPENPAFVMKDEKALNAHFGVTAMASVGFAQAQVAAQWLAEFTGNEQEAEHYVTLMLAGFYRQIAQSDDTGLRDALAALNTEGGLNQTLRNHMEDTGAPKNLRGGLDAFKKRLGLI